MEVDVLIHLRVSVPDSFIGSNIIYCIFITENLNAAPQNWIIGPNLVELESSLGMLYELDLD
jgi:hypothetical protein